MEYVHNIPVEFDSEYDCCSEKITKKYGAMVCPIYIPEKGEPQIIMFRVSKTGVRHGMIELPGGTKEANELPHETAARETREESCNYLDIYPENLKYTAYVKNLYSFCFFIKVPFMSNASFQNNLYYEINKK